MPYKIFCNQRQQYYCTNDTTFKTLEDCEEELKSYHSVDIEGIEIMSLNDICEAFGWEIHKVEQSDKHDIEEFTTDELKTQFNVCVRELQCRGLAKDIKQFMDVE